MLGKMNETITIVSKTYAIDSEGFQTETTTTIWTGRACRNRKTANKAWVSSASYADATDLFVIRKPASTIDTSMFVIFNTNEFNIKSVELVNGMYLEILAKAVEPSGKNQL